MDTRKIEQLVRHAHDAQRFAQWVNEPLDAPSYGSLTPARAGRVWLRVGGIAAAAALALGITFLATRSTPPAPAPRPGELAAGRGAPRIDEGPAALRNDSQARTPILVASDAHDDNEAEIARWAFLDPGALEGTPSLDAERSVLLAVYTGAPEGCDCVDWRLADHHGVEQVNMALLSNAMSSPCRSVATDLTIYQVSGPRFLLPFHDEQARSLAACLVKSPEECLMGSPDAVLEQISSESSTTRTLDDMCASALAYCVPKGLTVTTTRLELAIR